MDREEVIKWLMIMKANLNSFPEVSNAKKIEALAEAIRLLKNEQPKEPRGSTAKNDLGVDCISRKQAIRELKESAEHHANDSREEALLRRDRDIIKALPPVTPIRPKGHWIPRNAYLLKYKCSECNYKSEKYNYCPNCGAEMITSED
jgi:hypothetical protein